MKLAAKKPVTKKPAAKKPAVAAKKSTSTHSPKPAITRTRASQRNADPLRRTLHTSATAEARHHEPAITMPAITKPTSKPKKR